jgi:flagellar M-ring protein FliF
MLSLKNAISQGKLFWLSRTSRQKGFLVGGAGVTLVLLGLLVSLMTTPNYKPLYTGLDPVDAQALAAQLDAQQIPHRISADGKTISVPADKLDTARLQTASTGMPHSGRMGFELFDKMSWGQTEFDEKVNYQRALEGELERTIGTLKGVESARVHLVLPTDSVFIDRQRTAKASVILKLKGGGISKDAAVGISRLVAGAVDELKPEEVSIIDADSAEALNGNHGGNDGAEDAEAALTHRLINTLEPIVGADRIHASVNIDYDEGSTEESQEKYDPSISAVLSEQKTQDQASGGDIAAGVPGTTSNVPAAKTTKPSTISGAPSSSQLSTTQSAQYGVNRVVIHSIEPAGRIRRITAAVLVDDDSVKEVKNGKVTYVHAQRSLQQMQQIRALADAVIGFDQGRGDSVSVENISFDRPSADETTNSGWMDQLQRTLISFSLVIRPMALLVLFLLAYLLVIRPVQKQVLALQGAGRLTTVVSATEELLPAAENTNLETRRRAAELKEQTVELIKQKPVNTARAVHAWLREES